MVGESLSLKSKSEVLLARVSKHDLNRTRYAHIQHRKELNSAFQAAHIFESEQSSNTRTKKAASALINVV